MTRPPHPVLPAAWPRARLAVLLCGALLAGCVVPPRQSLPARAPPLPWPTQGFGSANPNAPVPVAPLPAAPLPSPADAQRPSAGPPYPPAIAARFPDPLVSYTTPGLRAGRFSSTADIQGVMRELAATAAAAPNSPTVRILPLGPSQRGDAIDALILLRGPNTDAASVLASNRPTVLLIGQQHGDEPASAEALLVLARDLAQGGLKGLLDKINVIVVPRANPDGSAVALAPTANGIDLARDHLALVSPEAQALARLARDYRPLVVADFGEYSPLVPWQPKFNAIGKFDVLLQQASPANQPEFLGRAGEEWFRRPLIAALKTQGLSSEWLHTASSDTRDPTVSMGDARAETSRNIAGLKNSVGLQVMSRGVGLDRLHLQRRVHSLVVAGGSILRSTAGKATELAQLRTYVDKEVGALACRGEGVVEAATTPAQYDLALLNAQTGADRTLTVDWNSALALRKLKVRPRPCGYLLPPSATVAVQKLRLLGVQVMRVSQPAAAVQVEQYREAVAAPGKRPDTKGRPADAVPLPTTEIELARGPLDVVANSYYVPMAQPRGNLVLAALEPDSPDSFFTRRIVTALPLVSRVLADPGFKLDPIP